MPTRMMEAEQEADQHELLRESIAHWTKLATDEGQLAQYEAARGRYAGVHLSRERLYLRTATSLQMELNTSVPHCVCDHHQTPIPFTRCRDQWLHRSTRR